MSNLEAYTTRVYTTELTFQSSNYTSGLELGTEYNYTTIISSSNSKTYWKSELEDSRSFTSSTSTSLSSTREDKTLSEVIYPDVSTSSTTLLNTAAYRGTTTVWNSSELYTWSRSMVSLRFSHTGITSIVTVSSYGNYTTRSTSSTNKIREDTYVSSTIYKTVAYSGTNLSSPSADVSSTSYWLHSSSFYSSTSDIENFISAGVKSSIIYDESGSTSSIGYNYYTYSSTSSSRLVATRLSGTVFNSTKTNLWTSSSSTTATRSATNITYQAVDTISGSDYNYGNTTTSFTTYSYTSSVNNSSVTYKSITVFPALFTYSFFSRTAHYIDEYISKTSEATGSTYLGSMTLSILSEASTTTTETFSYSWSWVDGYKQWIYSNSQSDAVPRADDISHSIGYVTTTSVSFGPDGWVTESYSGYATTTYYYPTYWLWSTGNTSSYSSNKSNTTSGYSTTYYSSTTYTGQFDDELKISTTLSNYVSNVKTSSDSSSISSLYLTSSYANSFGNSTAITYSASSSNAIWFKML